MAIPNHPFTVHQFAELGLSRRQVRQYVETGAVRRVLRGGYAPGHLDDTPSLRAACAALLLPRHGVVCDQGAAWLLGIDCYGPHALDVVPRLDVASIGGADRSRRPELLGGKRTLQADEIVEIDGVRLTSPIRTVCDIACLRGRHRALAALDAFRRQFGITVAELVAFTPRYRGRRGCRQLRELVGYSDPRAESSGESWTRLEIIDAGLPLPQLQVWIEVPGWGRARLDHAYEHLKIAVEYDGEEFHGDEHRARDEARRRAMRLDGWIVIVVRKTDFAADTAYVWLGELRNALQERTEQKRLYSRGPSDVR